MRRHHPDELTYFEKAVLKLLTQAAEQGETCPTNGVIAEATRCTSGSDVIRRLEQRGLIEVERGNSKRVVTIVETGKRTAGHISKPHWRDRPDARAKARDARAKARKARAKTVSAIGPAPEELPRVDRDTCFWCGAIAIGPRCQNCRRRVR